MLQFFVALMSCCLAAVGGRSAVVRQAAQTVDIISPEQLIPRLDGSIVLASPEEADEGTVQVLKTFVSVNDC